MDESPGQIEEHIRSTRRELGSNLQELEDRVKDATDWRVQFGRHPGVFLGAAFGGGILLSAALGGGRRRERWRPESHEAPSRLHSAAPRERSATTQVWSKLKEGLAAAAGSHLSGLLGELISGFGQRGRETVPDRTAVRADNGSTTRDPLGVGTPSDPVHRS